MKPTTLRQLHRWLGLVFSLSILMSSGSGVLHTVMSRTQAPPPPARPAGGGLDVSRIRLSIPEAVHGIPPENIQAVNLRQIGRQPWYQVYVKGSLQPLYISAVDGTADAAQDERYAAEIASGFLGGASVHKTDLLTAFNREYLNIFRVLPVYRFDADDALQTRVYVSTATGSVTRHTDRQRQWEADAFTNFHKLGFIPNKDWRDGILAFMTLGAFFIALLGVVLFVATRPRRR
jgi:hypothetical protein